MSLQQTLTGLADAIRSKTGTTDPMTLAGMITAVQGIETGGGLPSGIRKLDYGTFIPATSTVYAYTHKIYHGLGEVPDFAVIFRSDKNSNHVGNPLVNVIAMIHLHTYASTGVPLIQTYCQSGVIIDKYAGLYSNKYNVQKLTDEYICSRENTTYYGDTEVSDIVYGINSEYKWIAGCLS